MKRVLAAVGILLLIIGIMRYQLRPADRGTPQYGEWLWNRQNLAVHLLNRQRQSALRTIETA